MTLDFNTDDIFSQMLEGQKPELDVVRLQRSEMQQDAECPYRKVIGPKHSECKRAHPILREVGTIIHAAAEEAIQACDMNLNDAAEYFAQELPKTRPDLQPEILRAGLYLANQLKGFAVNAVLGVEKTLTRSLLPATASRGEVVVVTTLDLVLSSATALHVLDYKTGYKDRTSQEAYDDFQSQCGVWCLWDEYPNAETIHWWYLNTRRHTRSYAKFVRSRSVGGTDDSPLTEEKAIEARIQTVARSVLEGWTDAYPNAQSCGWCDYAAVCDFCEQDIATIESDPKRFTDQMYQLEQRLDAMKKSANVILKTGRSLFGTKVRYDMEPKRKSSPRPSFKELAEDNEESDE